MRQSCLVRAVLALLGGLLVCMLLVVVVQLLLLLRHPLHSLATEPLPCRRADLLATAD